MKHYELSDRMMARRDISQANVPIYPAFWVYPALRATKRKF